MTCDIVGVSDEIKLKFVLVAVAVVVVVALHVLQLALTGCRMVVADKSGLDDADDDDDDQVEVKFTIN